ncbi:hypothetical protein Rhe02_15880 [Rhizocola hellebori]|uniref:Tetratricopeptide repeat protein n=1 Tax=Rhizocola hellebori TaxID=1392758 RepID=A0A8J3VEP8_9ACTN|nr:tetratricopeptide repeat protein [Rhizocola hellebori]GIH03521.1 hypothetical protein Rhe02_15880 [Rhizocola hellebori]
MKFVWRQKHSVSGWWLIFAAAAVMAVASMVSQLLPAVLAAAVVAAVGVLGAVASERGSQSLFDRRAQRHRALDDLFTFAHGQRLPLVRDITDPVCVGVHRAMPRSNDNAVADEPPPFVRRDRSSEVEAALGRSGFVLLVGESTAGKSRVAFEAIRACLPNHTFIRPRVPTAISAALANIAEVRRCVIWLDDLEQYLGVDGLTADLVTAVIKAKGHHTVLLGTIRAHERARYRTSTATARSGCAVDEVALAARQVLDLATEIRIDRRWSSRELERAKHFTHDSRIAEALTHADRFGVCEYLALAPQLLGHWHDAWTPAANPRGAAIVAAAVDARRAGYHRALPVNVLRDLHQHYLTARGGALLRPEPWEQALQWASEPLHATGSLLMPDDHRRYLAFDYLPDALDQDVSSEPVPTTTWQTLIKLADEKSANDIGWAAVSRKEWEHAATAYRRALDAGHLPAAAGLAYCLGQEHRHGDAAEVLRTTIASVTAGGFGAVEATQILKMRHRLAWWTGLGGNVVEALGIIRSVAEESAGLLGPDHADTLSCRRMQARWEGVAGDPAAALCIAQEVFLISQQKLGPDHPDTLGSRFEVAVWTGASGDAKAAAQLWQALDLDNTRLCGQQDEAILDVRLNAAFWLCEAGDIDAGLDAFERAVADYCRVLGDLHPHTVWAQLAWIGRLTQSKDPDTALKAARQIVEQCRAGLGADHPMTLRGELSYAVCVEKAGDIDDAMRELVTLIGHATRTLGSDHETTLDCRSQLARWTADTNQFTHAVGLYEALVADRIRVQGEGHASTRQDTAELQRWQHALAERDNELS